MDFLYLLAIIVATCGMKWDWCRVDKYIKKEQTQAINGIFVLLVFFRHFKQYITCGQYDEIFWKVDSKLGQLIVVLFLFYSGYGIMYSINSKDSYLALLPRRFIEVLLHFDMAVLLYALLSVFLHKQYSIKKVLLSLIGWESVGNSNWYIFAILCMYFVTFICGKLFINKNKNFMIFSIAIGCFIYVILLKVLGKSGYWYNTIFCFPAGMFYSNNISKINDMLEKNKKISFLYPVIALAGFVLSYAVYQRNIKGMGLVSYELASIMFSLLIVSITLFFKIGNPILLWLGSHVFEIYILQRIPMILLQNVIMSKYLFFGISLVTTLILTIAFSKVEKMMNNMLITKRA